MKIIRIAGIALATLLGLLVIGVAGLYLWFDGDKIKAEISRTVLEQKQRTLVIAGQPKLSVWPNVGIQLSGLTLTEHASKDEFAALDSARISVALMPLLRKQVQVRALDIEGLKLTLVKKKDGTLNIADLLGQPEATDPVQRKQAGKPAEPAKPAEPLQIDIDSIRIANAQLTWRDEKAGTTTALANLSLSTGHVLADTGKKTAAVDKLGLSLTLQGADRNATMNVVLNGVEGNADALKIASMALKLDAKAGDAAIKGQLSSPVAVNVAGQSVTLAQLTGSLDLAHPGMPMKSLTLPITGSLKVDALQQTAALELATQFDESKIATSVKIGKFAPLVLAFDLDVDKLNVDKYLPPKPAATTESAKAAAADSPVNLSALKGPTVNGAIRIGALQVSHLKLEKINAKLALAGGKLDVVPLSLNLYEGSTSGSLSVNAHGNAVAIKQALVGVSINPLMKDLVAKDLLEGRGHVSLDISTHGDTVGAMKKALTGSASLALKDGAIKGINLAQNLRDLKAKLGRADSTQTANANQKTDFSELTGSFKIANGVAHNDDLAMKSPFIRLGGAGDVDLGAGSINYLAKATVVGSEEGQGGKDAGQLKGLTVPVRLSGPFDALNYKIEFGAMLEDATKAKLEEKKQEIKAKAEEAVKDKAKDFLKGLLGK